MKTKQKIKVLEIMKDEEQLETNDVYLGVGKSQVLPV